MASTDFSINNILSNFSLEGARPTLFNVSLTNPQDSSSDQISQFLIQAASIPESTLGNIAVPYFGRVVNFAGDRTYAPWDVTVMNDETFAIRNTLEAWSDSINSKEQNLRTLAGYKSTATVNQLGKTGTTIRTYMFHGIYPARIDPIRLDWGDMNQFERFNVTFMYDYWEVSGGTTGNAGGV
jgi:hypothetical protein